MLSALRRQGAPLGAARELRALPVDVDYRPRDAQATVVHQVVREHLEDFLEHTAARSNGAAVPAFVERDLRRFLRCGVLGAGFARFACPGCRFERLVPLSCKRRGICSSCDGRRMTERAAHLIENVLPRVTMRQWVLTIPYRLRYLLAWDHALSCAVLGVFVRAVLAYQRKRARRAGIARGQSGAVTVIQRFASGLRLNLHGHTLVPDGVFYEDAGGVLRFLPLPPPSDGEIAELVATIRRRILRLLERRGLGSHLGEDDDAALDPVSAAAPALAPLLGASLQGLRAFGPAAGAPVERIGRDPHARWVESRTALQARLDGFDLHAAVTVPAGDAPALERLGRYLLRPAIAQDRLVLSDDDRVLVELETEWHDGTRELVLEPLELLARLASFIPRPRTNLILFHGVFAANAAWRARVVAYGRHEAPADRSCAHASGVASGPAKTEGDNSCWSALMSRAFGLAVLDCPRCPGTLRLVAVVQSPAAIRAILEHLGLPTAVPEPRASRAPPDSEPWWN